MGALMKQKVQDWLPIIFVLAITFLGATIRSHKLSTAPFFQDEFYTASHSDTRRFRIVDPAYYNLAYVSASVLGQNEFAYRLPAFLLGVLSIPMFFFCFRPLIGGSASAFGTIFLALNSWHLYHSANARFYTGVVFFAILMVFFFFEATRKRKLLFLSFHLATALGAVLFHATALVFSAAFWLVSILYSVLPKHFGIDSSQRRVALFHVAIGFLAACIALPYAISILDNWQSSGQTWGRSGIALILQTVNKLGPTITLGATAGILLLWVRNAALALALGTATAVSLIGFVTLSFLMPVRPDYFIAIAPIAFATAGYFCSFPSGAWKRVKQGGILAVMVAAMLPSTVSHVTHLSSYSVKDVVAFVSSEFRPGDSVINFLDGFRYYSSIDQEFDQFPASPYSNSFNWASLLKEHEHSDRTWVVVPIRRRDISPKMFDILTSAGKLVWREKAKRYDYSDFGAEVYLIDWSKLRSGDCLKTKSDSAKQMK